MTFIAGLLSWVLIGFCVVFIVSSAVEIVKKIVAAKRAGVAVDKNSKEGEGKD